MPRVFIDGSAGNTKQKKKDRKQSRTDNEPLKIDADRL